MNQTKQKKENRGGKREGAGRKPGRESLSVRQVKEFERAAEAMAKEHGKTLQEVVLGIVYDEETPRRDVLAAAKLYWDKSVIVAKEGGQADQVTGPAVFLPAKHPRLELVDASTGTDKG